MPLLQHALPLPAPGAPRGITLRPETTEDLPALGALYWDAYPKGDAAVDLEDAVEDMEGLFEGEYGEPLGAACLVAIDDATGALVGSIQTVTDAPWEGAPKGPFVVELFVHPDHRKRGLGTALLLTAAAACHAQGWELLVLNSLEETSADAIRLYRALGFFDYPGGD